MIKRFAFFALLALSACASNWRHYNSMADLTPEQRLEFTKVDAYYLGKAKEQGAFTLSCSPQQLTVSAVSTKPSYMYLKGPDGWWMEVAHGATVTTIGAEGCSQRASYQVLCGPNQDYMRIESAPCDVIPSSEAGRVVNQNNQEQQRLNEAAARQAAEQQQRQQQK